MTLHGTERCGLEQKQSQYIQSKKVKSCKLPDHKPGDDKTNLIHDAGIKAKCGLHRRRNPLVSFFLIIVERSTEAKCYTTVQIHRGFDHL